MDTNPRMDKEQGKLKPTILVIKASPWRFVPHMLNHPEYASILSVLHRYSHKFRFVLVGVSKGRTDIFYLKDNVLAYDLNNNGRMGELGYYFGLAQLLLRYRPRVVITFGLLNLLPVSAYSLFSWRSKYIPIFLGEFSYYKSSLLGKFKFKAGLAALKISITLSHRRTVLMFALSRYIQKRLEKLVPGLTGKIALVSYPIYSAFCQPKDNVHSATRSHSAAVLLTVAGIEPRKGLETLLIAASKIPEDLKILIKGSVRDVSYYRKLENLIIHLGLENNVVFDSKLVDYDGLASYYKSADLFVFPTREDCLGVVILEALNCGLPVIATAVGGVTDMIQDGANGILVRPDDPEQLATAIVSLLADKDLRRKLASNGRTVLNEYYYKNRLTLESALMKSLAKVEESS